MQFCHICCDNMMHFTFIRPCITNIVVNMFRLPIMSIQVKVQLRCDSFSQSLWWMFVFLTSSLHVSYNRVTYWKAKLSFTLNLYESLFVWSGGRNWQYKHESKYTSSLLFRTFHMYNEKCSFQFCQKVAVISHHISHFKQDSRRSCALCQTLRHLRNTE